MMFPLFNQRMYKYEAQNDPKEPHIVYTLVQYYDKVVQDVKVVSTSADPRCLTDLLTSFIVNYYDGSCSRKIFLVGIFRTVQRKGKVRIPSYEDLGYFGDAFAGIFVAPHGLSMYGEDNRIGGIILAGCPLITTIRDRQTQMASMNREELMSHIYQNCPYLSHKDTRRMKHMSKKTVVAKILKVELKSMMIDLKYVQTMSDR